MIKNLLLFSFLLISLKVFSQVDDFQKPKMNFYFNPNINVGYNLGNRIKENQYNDSEYSQQYYQEYIAPKLSNYFTYGISAVGGYHFFPNFALGTGLRYSYIDPNFHILYWMIQPKFIFAPGDEAFFVDLTYGKKINKSVVSNADFLSLKVGAQLAYSKHLSQEGGLFIETINLEYERSVFIGLSYGITIFSNKNYTTEGRD